MIGVLYEDGVRHELPAQIALALKAMGLGYQHIKPMHASYLKTFELCFRGIDGYEITSRGREVLTAWDNGHDYDPRTSDREHPAAAGVPGGSKSGAATEVLPAAVVDAGGILPYVSPLRDAEPESG